MTPTPTEAIHVHRTDIEPDNFELYFWDKVVPIIVRNPKVLHPRGSAGRIELITSFATSASRVVRTVVMITIHPQPGDIGEGTINIFPLICELRCLVVFVQ